MPESLHLDTSQVSLVRSEVPLGAIGGALLLGPVNEAVGRKMAIIISLILYTVGAGLEAGAVNYGMIVAGRVILGLAVGLEGGTVPMYVAECVESKTSRQPRLSLSTQHRSRRGFWLRRGRHLRQCQARQLALHARLLSAFLNHHAGRYDIYARKPPIPYAQRTRAGVIRGVEAHTRLRIG